MPSAWSWTSIAELLTYGSSLIAGAHAYCGATYGTAVQAILPWLDAVHVWVLCGS
jgi:hypothetical protein